MPLEFINGGYRWGKQGKIYYGKGAKEKALAQGRAIEMSKRGTIKKKKRGRK